MRRWHQCPLRLSGRNVGFFASLVKVFVPVSGSSKVTRPAPEPDV